VDEGTPPDEVAVLVRTYSLSVSLELELHHHSIPYFVYGRPPLTRIPEISALVGVLQLASGRWKDLGEDEVNFIIRSLLQRPALYLDKVATDKVVQEVSRHPEKLSDAIRSVITPQTKPFHADQIRDRADLLDIIRTSTEPDAKVKAVLDLYLSGTNFEKVIAKQSPTAEMAEAVLANVAAFKLIANRHEGTIAEFLEEIDPLIDSSKTEPPDEPHVWIGSIHRAKGAQWPHVFVPGLAARAFPRENLEHEQIEAERRLFYVAITRASEQLFIAHPLDEDFKEISEDIDSKKEMSNMSPVSQFVWEMDLALARHAGTAVETGGPFTTTATDRPEIANTYFQQFPFASEWSYARRPKVHRVAMPSSAGAGDMPAGTRVRHPLFGPGKVDRWVDDRVVRVAFDNGDTRMLVAYLAGLSVEGSTKGRSYIRPPVADDFPDDGIPF
jgi:DNA helicase-2/ATP-dependent DNA helicase PcrA